MPNQWYPRAIRRPLPEATTQPLRRATQYLLHSIVGSAEGAFRMFRDSSDLESTLILPKQGVPWQLLPINRTADANFHANQRAVSVETEDNGHPDTDPWTDSQLRELILLGIWLKTEHDIPTDHLIRVGECNEAGTGYHSLQSIREPSGILGSSCWTPVRGKTCPGVIRIKQFYDVIMPALRNEEDDLPYSREELLAISKAGSQAANNEATIFGQPDWPETVRDVIVKKLDNILSSQAAIFTRLDLIEADLAAPPAPPTV